MLKMSFSSRWVDLVLACIRSVTYSTLLNGQPYGLISLSRGLRQSYLFLLINEDLQALFKKVDENGNIRGVSLCVASPCVSHLLFADDSLLFCRAIVEECGHVLDILKNYEETSGQKVNRDKTSLFFSKSIPNETKSSIKQAL